MREGQGRGADGAAGSAGARRGRRRRRAALAVLGVLGVLAGLALASLQFGYPVRLRGPSGTEYDPDTVPREGQQLPVDIWREIDRAHRERVEAFPARTRGKGLQPLPYRMDGGVKVFELTAAPVRWEVEPGIWREAWAYNGQVPGPVIRVVEGDRVRVILHNRLPESTSIHWHGLQVENSQDGVAYVTTPVVPPGGTFTYEFTARPAGTHMYHPHHNSTKQLALGLLGPFIVEPRDRSALPPYDKEVILVLNDGPLGFTINGKSFPATEPIVARRGERVLIRWLNEGALAHPMHLHGLVYQVVARDGHPLPQPWKADTIHIAPGERWDVIVEADNPGKWALHCHVLPHAEGESGLLGLTTVFVVNDEAGGGGAP